MKRFLLSVVPLSVVLIACCGGVAGGGSPQNEEAPGAPEATAEQAGLSWRDIPVLDQAFIDTAPAERNDGLVVGTLGADGGDEAMVVQLATEIGDGRYGNYDSFLITHKGKLVFESYYRRGRINLPHSQASATKGHTALILGRALQLGYLSMDDLDKPLIGFLDDLDETKLVAGAEKITLHKALTMHGGLSVSDETWEELQQNPDAIKGQLFIQALLEQSGPITDEAQTYLYGNFNPMLVMAVIDAVVPGTAQDFIKDEVLGKLGITDYRWRDHISGLPVAGSRASIMSRDMLKLGLLVLNEGKWNGEQLIPAAYLEKATSGLVKPTQDWMPDEYRYGYFWYRAPLSVGGDTYDASFAWGGGGQRVIVVDDLELTMVITGHDREDDTIMAQIIEKVLPGFVE